MMRRAAGLRSAGRAGFAAAEVPHSRPCLGRDEEEAALRVLRSGRLAAGDEARRGAAHLARVTGNAGAVLLSSGTTALTLAMRALGIGALVVGFALGNYDNYKEYYRTLDSSIYRLTPKVES